MVKVRTATKSIRKPALGAVVALAAILLALPAMPVGILKFAVAVLYLLFWHIVLAASYDLVGGQMGYINLGHASFFGIGGYAFGVLVINGFPMAFSFAAAPIFAAVFAGLISFPFFRLKGAYFALAAFGLVGLLELAASNMRWLTGGVFGLYVPPGFRDVPAYYIALLLAAAAVFVNFLISRSGIGLALASIREDEEVAQAFGVNLFRYKALTLMISASFAGMMGGVFVWKANYADPPLLFGLERALVPIVMAMLGGSGTILGPIIGALFLTVVEEFLWAQMPYLHLAVYGVILATVGLFMPGGIARTAPVRKLLSKFWKEA